MADLTAVNVLLDDENDLQPQSDEDGGSREDKNGENDRPKDDKDENESKRSTDDGKDDKSDSTKSDLKDEDKDENELQAAADDKQEGDKTVKTERLCGLCEELVPTPATNCFCIQCAMYLCSSCVQTHKKIPITKQHTITDVAEESTNECWEEYSYCTRHVHVQMKYYCTACRFPICSECMIVNHRQHDITEIEQEVEAVKSRLGKARELMETRLTHERKYRVELETKLSDFVTHQKTVEQDLERSKQSRLSSIRQTIEYTKQSYAEVEKVNEKLCTEYTTEIEEAIQQVDQRIRQLNQTADELAQLADGNRSKTDYVCLVIPDVTHHEEQEKTAAVRPQLVKQVGSTSREMAVQTSGSVARDIGSQTSDGASQNRSMQTCERCAPEGQITFRVINIRQFQPRVWHEGHEVKINDVPWSLPIRRYRADDGDYLAFGIVCNRNNTLPSSFRVRTSFSLRLIHPTSEQLTKELEFTHTFTKDKWSVGDSRFYPWQGLVDDGFVSDGGIQLEATIKVLETSHVLLCPDC